MTKPSLKRDDQINLSIGRDHIQQLRDLADSTRLKQAEIVRQGIALFAEKMASK
jgi:hypothetical protein